MPNKRKKLKSLITKLTDICEFPLDCVQSLPIVELKGNGEVFVSGYLKITEYSPCFIILDAGDYLLEICGEGLLMREFAANSVQIHGIISCIRLC